MKKFLSIWVLSLIAHSLLLAQTSEIKGILPNNQETLLFNEYFISNDYHPDLAPNDVFGHPMATWHGNTYFVYVNKEGRPIAGVLDRNKNVSLHFIDKNELEPYRANTSDGHHVFNIGVDKEGYIHIAGDMHGYQYGWDYSGNGGHYPDRLDGDNGAHLLYWRSTNPEDISDFQFIGNVDSLVIPGFNFSYVYFQNDQNGELYAKARCVAGPPEQFTKYTYEDAFVISKYNIKDRSWTALGDNSYFGGSEDAVPAIYFASPEIVGRYQGMQRDYIFDFNNRLHTAVTQVTEDEPWTSALLYAYSDDDFKTAYRADGSKIESFPFNTLEDGHAPDVLFNTTDQLGVPVLLHDKEGIPIIVYSRKYKILFNYFDTLKNSWSNQKTFLSYYFDPSVVDANGILSNVNKWGSVGRCLGIDEEYQNNDNYPKTNHSFGESYYQFSGRDLRSIKEGNLSRAFAYNNNNSTLKIYEFGFDSHFKSDLPDHLNKDEIGSNTQESYMINDVFNLQSDGKGLVNGNYNGLYLNQLANCDFEITCRVIQMDYHSDDTYAGLMVSNNPGDLNTFYTNVITWHGNETWLKEYNKNGNKSYVGDYNEPSEWLRIKKVGDTLFSYRSDNSLTWDLLETKILAFNDVVYAGLINGSSSNSAGFARIDHFEINVTHNCNDNSAPIITNHNLTIDDNMANGALVMNVNASDPDAGQTLTYAITAGNTSTAFGIDNAGKITVENSGALKTNDSFNLTIKVTDNGSPQLSATATLIINITHINDPPVINNKQVTISDDKSIGNLVTTVSASDPDNGQTLSYSITAGNTASSFNIDNSGKITVNNPDALKVNDVFNLTIQATDDGSPVLSGTGMVTININHINDPPVVQDEQVDISDDVTANTIIATLTASDPDINQTLSFSITSGNSNTVFEIDQSGNIMVNKPNALLTKDLFSLTVTVTDNGSPSLSSNAWVTISVNHVNDPPVVHDQQVSISDDILQDELVTTVIASDPDPGQELTFSITGGNTGNAFYIDNSGNLKVNDISSLKQKHSFQLLVNVSDNGNPVLSADATVDILVNHVNDPPVVNNQQVTISDQLTNGSFVMQVNAHDPDVGQTLSYDLISGNQNNAFSLDNNGRISVSNHQALSSVNVFQLIVEVSDNGSPGMTSAATMSIYIDHNVHIQPVIPVAPGNMNGSVIGQNILLSWADKSSNEDNFVVQRRQNSGLFENLTTLDANITSFEDETVEDGNSYNYRVYAKNEAGNSALSNEFSIEYTDTSLYALKAPSNLEYTLNKEMVDLTWDDISNNESGFILEKKNLLTNDVIIDTIPPNVTAYTDQNTKYSDELEYRISNFNKLFRSAHSNTVYVKIQKLIEPIHIETPTGFNGQSFHSDSIHLSWTYANLPNISFLIEKIDHTNQNTTLNEVSGSLRNYVDKNIDALSTYYYRIAATNGADTSLFSSYLTITAGETKNPFNTKAPEIAGYELQNNDVDLFFNDQYPGEEYIIERSISDTLNFFQIGNIPVEQGRYSDNLLFRDLFIYYRIKSTVDDFESPYSAILKVINPNAYNEYDFVADAVLTSDQEYELTWNEMPGCTHYTIERKLYGEPDFSTIETNIKSLKYTAYFPFGNIGEVTYMISACYDTVSLITSNAVTIDNAFIKGYDQFQATNHINASILLSWNRETISEGSKTILYRSNAGAHNFKVVSSTFENQYLDTTLEANKTYSYYIEYYVNEGRMKVTSDIETITTNESFQLVQPIIQNIETDANKVSFTWLDSSTYSKKYVVERSPNPNKGYQPISELSEDSFFIDGSVESGKSYYYRVRAVIESVWNVYSAVKLIYVPSGNEAERMHEGMVAGYNFYNGGIEIPDVSNFGDPLNLVETDNHSSKIGKEKQQPVYTSVYAADKILESVKLSGTFSMECWLKPLDTKTSGLQQIVSIENNSGRLFGLFQDNGTGNGIHDYLVNFRTGSTNEMGKPDFRVNKAYDYHAVHHIVYTRNKDGKEKIYMDGKLLNSNVRPSNINNWLGKYYLTVAGKSDGNPSWKGNIYYLAIYNTVMKPEYIDKNYQAGPYKGFHNAFTDISIQVYPNPAQNYVNVHLTPVSDFISGERIKLMVINQTGTMIHQQVITDPSYEQIIELALDDFKPGIYLVYVMGDGWKKTKRLVVK